MKITLSAKSIAEMKEVCKDFLGMDKIVEHKKSDEPVKDSGSQKPKIAQSMEATAEVRSLLTQMLQHGKADIVYSLLEKHGVSTISELASCDCDAILQEIKSCTY